MTILASYSEIALKSRYVRNTLEKQLAQQIQFSLKRDGFTGTEVTREYGRIYVEGAPPEAAETVSKVFGVVAAMPSTKTTIDLEDVVTTIVDEAKKTIKPGEGFAVRPKVVGNHPFNSRDVAIEAGSKVLEALKDKGVHVHLDAPDVTLYVEVRDKASYIYSQIVHGVKGLPYGSQGTAVSLFSGGIDSPTAMWLMMKRGVGVMPLFMDQRPYVGDSYVERAKKAFQAIARYAPVKKFHLYAAPMGPIMERIMESPEPRFTCVLCKRSMYRMAEFFAEDNKAEAIITGESLGQVASQTLNNMHVIDRVATMPVLRPLVGLDKVEIEDIARRVGTYSITARKVEGCKCVPDSPATRSRLNIITELEEKLDLVNLCKETAGKITVIDSA
ncbi:MAG: tRNA 4-thiouridine(8) synthase ThiI [Candidatus Bathyarchaeota archaeon]|nr:tRNA 4-thiouridine(8) synthase ThiI [Candidatus Bathyarchaeota archaeon]